MMKKGLLICALLVGIGMATQAMAGDVGAKYDGKIYGYLHLSMSYDAHSTATGNYVLYVKPENDTTNNDNQLNITASQTRLGYAVTGPDVAGAISKGKVEMDFYGGGAENKAMLRMRHAFMEVVWPNGISLLAGQTWDLMMTQYPSTVNLMINYYAGNYGFWRPQIRLTKTMDMGDAKLLAKVALARNIGTGSPDTGTDSQRPVAQFCVQYKAKAFDLGVSGHYGQEEHDIGPQNLHDTYQTWSGRFDVNVPMGMFGIKGSIWRGANLGSYLGGIGSRVISNGDSVHASGGWGMIKAGPINVGAGIDRPDYDHIAAGAMQQNVGAFINTTQKLHEAVKMGLELSYWQTMYKEAPDGDALRAQITFSHGF
jgi:hypothetical protein